MMFGKNTWRNLAAILIVVLILALYRAEDLWSSKTNDGKLESVTASLEQQLQEQTKQLLQLQHQIQNQTQRFLDQQSQTQKLMSQQQNRTQDQQTSEERLEQVVKQLRDDIDKYLQQMNEKPTEIKHSPPSDARFPMVESFSKKRMPDKYDPDFHWPTLWAKYLEYEQLMREKKINAKVIICDTLKEAGLGNKFPGILTAMAFALITNRVLHIQWHHSFGWGAAFNNSMPIYDTFDQGRYVWANNPPTQRSIKWELGGHGADFKAFVLTKNLTSEWHEDIITWLTTDYNFPYLAENPFYKNYFGQNKGMGIFRLLGSKLLIPVDEIKKEMIIRRKNYRKLNIGLQMRMLKRYEEPKFPPPDMRAYFDVAKMIQLEYGLPDSEVAYFLTTDDQVAVLKAAKEFFGDGNVWVTEEGVPGRYTLRGDLLAVEDLLLLSEMDELVISQGSSFGQVAGALGGIKIYSVGFPGNLYRRTTISEPCSFSVRDWTVHMKPVPPQFMHFEQCHPGTASIDLPPTKT